VTFESGEGFDSILEGFTIMNGSGGVNCDSCTPTIKKNTIIGNSSSGILCTGNATVRYNTIRNNNHHGIHCNFCSPTIENNIIDGNSIRGVHSIHASPNILGNTIFSNSSSGIFCSYGSATITNNIIYGNGNTDIKGGGINCSNGVSATITNNTIYGNSAGRGGGIACRVSSSAQVTNTILWNNTASDLGPEIYIAGSSNPSMLAVSYSDIEGGLASVVVQPGCTLDWGDGMIDADPLFINEVDSDYHLTYSSPCKDEGDNSGLIESYDFEGDPRIAYGTVDIGADEFYTHLYCTGDITIGGSMEGKLVGLPGTSPVVLFFGIGVLDPPMMTAWGSFYLQPPWFLLPLIPIPGNGILVLPATIPTTPPAPYDLPMQALIGLAPDSLTNLWVLEVR
jgi:hypothetical protein